MNRTITVKGTGKVSVKPDLIVITFTLKSLNKIYEVAMSDAAELMKRLRDTLIGAGFSEDDLKTLNFRVYQEHESVQDKNAYGSR